MRCTMEDSTSTNEKQKLFIGVDGGGSKTRFFLSDIEANAYKVVEAPSTNKNSVGGDAARNNLHDGLGQLREHPQFAEELIAGICVGMAGVSAPAYVLFPSPSTRPITSFVTSPPGINCSFNLGYEIFSPISHPQFKSQCNLTRSLAWPPERMAYNMASY